MPALHHQLFLTMVHLNCLNVLLRDIEFLEIQKPALNQTFGQRMVCSQDLLILFANHIQMVAGPPRELLCCGRIQEGRDEL
jgi:hypothetical protein